MTKKIKIYIAIAVIVIVSVVSGIVGYGSTMHRAYLKAVGQIELLEQKAKDDKALSDFAIAVKNEEIAQKTKDLNAALAAAADSKQHDATITAKYNALKGEVAAAPPEALSRNVNAFIGDNQSWPTAGGSFSFTRIGTERTLTFFYEGKEYRAKYENGLVTIANLESAVSSAVAVGKAWKEKFGIQGGELKNINALYLAEHNARVRLARSIFGRRVQSFVIGAGVGAAIVIVYNIVKKES